MYTGPPHIRCPLPMPEWHPPTWPDSGRMRGYDTTHEKTGPTHALTVGRTSTNRSVRFRGQILSGSRSRAMVGITWTPGQISFFCSLQSGFTCFIVLKFDLAACTRLQRCQGGPDYVLPQLQYDGLTLIRSVFVSNREEMSPFL